MLATVVFITINNIGGKNFGEFGELKHFIKFSHQFFTISITFLIQMDFNLPNFLCKPPTVERHYSPNFFYHQSFNYTVHSYYLCDENKSYQASYVVCLMYSLLLCPLVEDTDEMKTVRHYQY